MKKKILGTSDAWSMRRSSHRRTNTVYYIEDYRILKWYTQKAIGKMRTKSRNLLRSSVFLHKGTAYIQISTQI